MEIKRKTMERKMETITLTGNTYPIKDQIKARGGKWDPVVKGWKVQVQYAEELKAMMQKEKTFEHQGQLWEECEFCGNEPIYMPYMVCESCAKRGRRA